jgi:hypothetical protein
MCNNWGCAKCDVGTSRSSLIGTQILVLPVVLLELTMMKEVESDVTTRWQCY